MMTSVTAVEVAPDLKTVRYISVYLVMKKHKGYDGRS